MRYSLGISSAENSRLTLISLFSRLSAAAAAAAAMMGQPAAAGLVNPFLAAAAASPFGMLGTAPRFS